MINEVLETRRKGHLGTFNAPHPSETGLENGREWHQRCHLPNKLLEKTHSGLSFPGGTHYTTSYYVTLMNVGLATLSRTHTNTLSAEPIVCCLLDLSLHLRFCPKRLQPQHTTDIGVTTKNNNWTESSVTVGMSTQGE